MFNCWSISPTNLHPNRIGAHCYGTSSENKSAQLEQNFQSNYLTALGRKVWWKTQKLLQIIYSACSTKPGVRWRRRLCTSPSGLQWKWERKFYLRKNLMHNQCAKNIRNRSGGAWLCGRSLKSHPQSFCDGTLLFFRIIFSEYWKPGNWADVSVGKDVPIIFLSVHYPAFQGVWKAHCQQGASILPTPIPYTGALFSSVFASNALSARPPLASKNKHEL